MDGSKLSKDEYSQTEFIVFGSKQQLKKVEVASINVNGDSIPKSEVIKYQHGWTSTLILDNISLRNVMWQ